MKRFLAHAKYSCCTVLSKSNENELHQIWPIVLAKYRQTFAEISPGETKFRQNGGVTFRLNQTKYCQAKVQPDDILRPREKPDKISQASAATCSKGSHNNSNLMCKYMY